MSDRARSAITSRTRYREGVVAPTSCYSLVLRNCAILIRGFPARKHPLYIYMRTLRTFLSAPCRVLRFCEPPSRRRRRRRHAVTSSKTTRKRVAFISYPAAGQKEGGMRTRNKLYPREIYGT